MADVFSKAKRSQVMSRIRSRGNRDTELALAKLCRAQRITGWRRHVEICGRAALPRGRNYPLRTQGTQRKDGAARQHRPTFRVRPDFVFPKLRLAVFVDGCFWHCCPLHATRPRHNATFWRRKLATNRVRDRRVTRTLRSANWRVLRLWEHELARKHEARLLRRIRRALA